MKVHVLVEGPSERAFIAPWARRAFKGHSFVTHPHQGKGSLPNDLDAVPDRRRRGLLDQLPATLRAYADVDDAEIGVVVLVDVDEEDCANLRQRLLDVCKRVAPKLRVVVRIAIEETEAFYLGDLGALAKAFPDADLEMAADYEPDSICGTAELFGRVVGDGGLNKVSWAQTMGPRVTTVPGRSRSPSFRALHRGIARLVESGEGKQPKRRPKHWRARSNEWRKK